MFGQGVMHRLSLMLCGWVASLSLNAQEAPAAANALAASPSLSGYVSTSYHLERGAGNRNYRNADSVGNGWSLDHVALSLHLPLNEWLFDAGYRIDAWLGPDASLLESGSSSDNTVELRQAYIDFRIPLADPRNGGARSIDLRAGLFDNPFGYESLDRNLNPHHTHSWGFTIEPTLHTGLLLLYPGVDVLENGEADYLLTLGTANTMDPRTNAAAENDNRKTWIAGLTTILPESLGPLAGTAVSAGYSNGRARTGAEPIQNIYLALGLPLPQEDWSVGLVYDARVLGGPGNDDSVLGAYIGRRLNDRLWLNLRGEVFQEGDKLFSGESAAEQTDGYGLTTTLDYRLWSNVTSRLGYRWDHTDAAVNDRRDHHGLHLNLIYEF